MSNEKIIIRIKKLGLNDVDWNKYDFHLTPVLTYSVVKKEQSLGKCLAVEWGHWAVYIGIFRIKI